jgi:hypothetical protein
VLPRQYDMVPDVMVYADGREHDPAVRPGFPNGRHIQDDVAAITCAEGDCVLQELSFVEGAWPRRTTSDKPVPPNATFPYLLEPYQEGQFKPTPAPPPSIIPLAVILGVIVLVLGLVMLWLLIQGVKYRLLLRPQREVI